MPHIKLTYSEIQQQRLTEAQAATSIDRLPVIAILENIRSLYNVGSIFRTADGARLEAIYTVGYTANPSEINHPRYKEIEKTSLGATRTVPTLHFETIEEAIASVRALNNPPAPSDTQTHKSRRFRIASLEISSHSRSVFELGNEDFPIAVIIGNEITGVSEEAVALSDFTIEIPMFGAKHSLNVAVAFGIAAFECVRVHKIPPPFQRAS
ncbi:MAG TPA: TrmH family RNA methyltransferase [Candidatus Kapabacteria bacterium]|jgi:tRNA G18 (ribose-2'-O)-methylase SpoU